jgi:hypothetical protein
MSTCLGTECHNCCARATSAAHVLWQSFFAVHRGPKVSSTSSVLADRPAIAQFVKQLTEERSSNQMVLDSIPGGRILVCVRASTCASQQWLHCESAETMRGACCPHIPQPGFSETRSFCVSASATYRRSSKMTLAGLGPAILGSEDQRLLH